MSSPEGCYDPSVYPLVELWGFAAGEFLPGTPPEGGIPSQEEIDAALALVGFDRAFSLDPNALTVTKLIDGAKLDLGGIAKGYAAQLALRVRFDICNVGGNIFCGQGKSRHRRARTERDGDGQCIVAVLLQRRLRRVHLHQRGL